VAFLDDDAPPSSAGSARPYRPSKIPAPVVGGIVFRPFGNGAAVSHRPTGSERLPRAPIGHTTTSRSLDRSHFLPAGHQRPVSAHRAQEIGGFDETFDYYLDETDVCCRIVDAGYVLRQLANAPVHHKFLSSNIRSTERVVTNWFPVIKNFTYLHRHAG
jgi:hypothetical protein